MNDQVAGFFDRVFHRGGLDTQDTRIALKKVGLEPTEQGFDLYRQEAHIAYPNLESAFKGKVALGEMFCHAVPADGLAGKKNVVFSIGRDSARDKQRHVNFNLALDADPESHDPKHVPIVSGQHAVLVVDFDPQGRPQNIRVADIGSTNGTYVVTDQEDQELRPGALKPIQASTFNVNGVYRDTGTRIRFGTGDRTFSVVSTDGAKMNFGKKEGAKPVSFLLLQHDAPPAQQKT